MLRCKYDCFFRSFCFEIVLPISQASTVIRLHVTLLAEVIKRNTGVQKQISVASFGNNPKYVSIRNKPCFACLIIVLKIFGRT